ncbi:TKL/TKL-ccin protein kinase [Mycena chlorophos]|uniref:TKL/TKL-ccin protein kinase n=1 Tax=Mycena chlorophos TaxID=658473 RepID=A0A8H6SUX7_MYCCL|nr:TKL/TKL-ccin protein kinase [Mycena chlorophos]
MDLPATVAGGTFRSTDRGDPGMNALATGKFFVLSALLYESTQNQTYLDRAKDSFAFIKNHLFLAEDGWVLDSFDSANCNRTIDQTPDNYGLFIEGMAVLYSTTGDMSVQAILNQVVSVVLATRDWQGDDGIIAFPRNGNRGSADLIHGLRAAYERKATSTELHHIIAQYLTVQFHAVTELSSVSGTFVYSGQWIASSLRRALSPPNDQPNVVLPGGTIASKVLAAGMAIIVVVSFLFWLTGRSRQRRRAGRIRLQLDDEEDVLQAMPLREETYPLDGQITREDRFPRAGGGNADIFRGTLNRPNGRKIPVAIKVLRLSGNDSQHKATFRRMKREVRVWSQLKHPNVLPFLGVCGDLFGWPVLVSPFYEDGHVGEYLKKYPEADRHALTLGAANGLTYLHRREMVHGDLKVQNVLVDANGRAVICDFGLAKIVNERGFTSNCIGTVAYMAPELFTVPGNHSRGRWTTTTKATDVYSFGLLGLEIFSGEPPKRRQTNPVVTERILADMQPRREDVDADVVAPEIWSLLEKCWHSNARMRPTMTRVLRLLETLGRPQQSRSVQKSKMKNPLRRLLPHLVTEPLNVVVSVNSTYMCRFDRPQSGTFEVDDFVPAENPTVADRHTLYWVADANEWAPIEEGLTPRILNEAERAKYVQAVEACKSEWAWDDADPGLHWLGDHDTTSLGTATGSK